MLDIKLIRENTDAVKKALEKRGPEINFGEVLGWDSERRKLIAEMEALQVNRNKAAEQVGRLKKEGKDAPEELVAEMDGVREQVKEKERFLVTLEQNIEDFLLRIPNIPDESVTVGKSADDNKVVSQSGEIPKYDFAPKAHWEIGEKLGVLDFETAAKLSGSRFVVLKDKAAFSSARS